MSITLNFELNDRDLAHFREAGERARKAAQGRSEQEIIAAAIALLDDAVMIELSMRELKHELAAYDDFCDYREREARNRGTEPAAVGRAAWLEGRREELVERMHQRRERDYGSGYGGSSGYASNARGPYVRGWRPGVFRVG